MSGLMQLLQAVTPPPPRPASREYDGFEIRWKMFAFRPAIFVLEGVMLGVLGLYALVFLIGRTVNQSRARAAITPYKALIDAQFAASRPLLSSGPTLHLLYSSGRRNMMSLHTTLSLLPYHDVAGLVVHLVKSIIEPTYDGSEGILFELTLGRGETGLQGEGVGVWAVVDKGLMRQTREKRWDLTFPRLQDSVNVPITHALFTEHSDCSDVMLKTPNVGISELLSKPEAAGVLKYLLVTDVPPRRPSKGPLPVKYRSREVILAVRKPSNPAQEQAVKAWLQVALNVADLLAKPILLKPDVSRKLINTRKTVDTDLTSSHQKEQAEDNPPEETAEDKRLAKKRAERAAMSEKELKKAEELDKKREFRKMQKRGQTAQMGK